MSQLAAPPRSLLRELVEGVFTLFVGLFLQIGRSVKLIGLGNRRKAARAKLRETAVRMGGNMAEAGIGNQMLLQKLHTLPETGPDRAAALEELGVSGLEPGVPLLGLETEYRAGRQAYEDAQTAERKYDETAGRIWPTGVIGWAGLIGSYILTPVALWLLFAYLSPSKEPAPTQVAPVVEFENIRVRLKSAVIGRQEIRVQDGKTTKVVDDGVSLRLTLTIENTGSRAVNYESWRGKFNALQDAAARVIDSRGQTLPRLVYKFDLPPEGGIGSATIEPGASVEDLVLFGPPEPKFNKLELFLPGDNVGKPGETLQMTIPLTAIQLPESFK